MIGNAQMDRQRLLDLNRVEHDFLRRTVDALTNAQQVEPGVIGQWSPKDILAHVVFWEQRFLAWVRQTEAGEPVERPAEGYTWDDLDRLNASNYEANRDRSYTDVLAEFERSFHGFNSTLGMLPEAALFTPGYYPFTREYPLWQQAAANGFEHYREHALEIRRWAGGA